VRRVAQFDPSPFACQIGAEVRDWDPVKLWDAKEVRRNDRYTHFGFVAARQAVADSGLDLAREDGDRVGSSSFGYRRDGDLRAAAEGPGRARPAQGFALHDSGADRQHVLRPRCDRYGARGPTSGCFRLRTGTHALGEAAHAIRRGEADIMIAGGSEAAITPFAYASFAR